LAAENYSLLCQAGGQAYKAKKFELALEKYSRAHKVAGTPAQKFRIIPVQITLYQQLKKTAELEKFLEKERQDDRYNDTQLRYLLNWNARIHIWPRRDMRYAMELLNMARMLPVVKTNNTYFETFFLMGEIYYRNKQYDYVIYYLSPLPEIKNFHPSNSYKISMMVGRAYRAKGDRKKALQWFEKALASGKKVPYKYNYSEAEKYIKELSK
jgi:tetratricopeptide (TPR) repeat protein